MNRSLLAPHVDCELANETATLRFAENIAAAVLPGDVIALEGDLGAGKTAFCRALIKTLASNPELEVPSPTFSLMQPYAARLPVRHFDLYRLGDADELDEIGFFDDLDTSLTLVEWASRAGSALPDQHIILTLDILDGDRRRAQLFLNDNAVDRFQRSFHARRFLDEAGYANAIRSHVQGDASHRAYERIQLPEKPSAIFMNAPATPPGEIVSNGQSYADLVHRASDTRPFEAIGQLLLSEGFSAPNIYNADHKIGFMLLEDFGCEGILTEDKSPNQERYLEAADMLAALHNKAHDLSQTTVGPNGPYTIPTFDRTAFLTEVSLFADWYLLHRGGTIGQSERAKYLDIWATMYDHLESAETGVIMRDVHSPNLMWLEDREATQRIGLLDFQDALWGPHIYDLASLVYDARVEISPQFRQEMLQRYYASRRKALEIPLQSQHLFILAAQRIAKILGIFARLAQRDVKVSYLTHMPRNEAYLNELLRNPILAPLASWHEAYLPQS